MGYDFYTKGSQNSRIIQNFVENELITSLNVAKRKKQIGEIVKS